MSEPVSIDINDRVGIVTLSRPESLNAINIAMAESFRAAVADLDANDDVRVLIVRGAGERSFSVGYDLKDAPANDGITIEEIRAKYEENHEFARSVWTCSKPVIAMIDGYCLAGALEMALCCDIRYCSDASSLGVLEARFGGGIGTLMLPWIIGHKCRELIYTGDILTAREACDLGLVDRVVPKDELLDETVRTAKRMSRVAQSTQRWNKRVINRTFELMGLEGALEQAKDGASIMRATGSPERQLFDRLKEEKGLREALKWRKSLFETFERNSRP